MKTYPTFERLRVAGLTTFISGFINAYTFNTEGGRFAGIQSGNLLGLMIHLAKGNLFVALSYLIPLVSFTLGQFVAYFGRRWARANGRQFYQVSAQFLLGLMTTVAVLSPYLSRDLLIALLAFFASIQLDTFRQVRGISYANIMMTGNIKNAAALWIKGVVEKDTVAQKQANDTLIIILTFMIGVMISTFLTAYVNDHLVLYLGILPVLAINYMLANEKHA